MLKNDFSTFLLFTVLATALSLTSCEEECSSNPTEEIGDEFFTVEYVSPSGVNYLNNVYDPSAVVVYMDPTGGDNPFPEFELIRPGFEDGKFGPFRFTETFVNQATGATNDIKLFGIPYRYDYYFKKGDFGQDTLSLQFFLDVDECGHSWRNISYSLNGQVLTDYQDLQQAEIIVTE
ncbi:MAG: hypothetical protein AAF824_06025 [Bacteroidota bacterium]